MKLLKLFTICVTACVAMAFIDRMANNHWYHALQETGAELTSYQVPLSHGMLPDGYRWSCVEMKGYQKLQTTSEGRMMVILPPPQQISIGCQILPPDEAIDVRGGADGANVSMSLNN